MKFVEVEYHLSYTRSQVSLILIVVRKHFQARILISSASIKGIELTLSFMSKT